ncbi:MAG: glutamine-hydrolyzing carbamoyl-phosphate synthase small subunit [Bdellovibrionales bacterium]
MRPSCLVLETGEIFSGYCFEEVESQAGEVVFNTSHSGYEEISTDPSYFSQILVMTAPLQGNYGASKEFWESQKVWIKGFLCVEMQNTKRENHWMKTLKKHEVPLLTHIDTRRLVLRLRDQGVVWGAIVPVSKQSKEKALNLIKATKKSQIKDWTQLVSTQKIVKLKGEQNNDIKLALIDFGFKKNILRELLKRVSEVSIFPSRLNSLESIKKYLPDGILLSNGPGDPKAVIEGTKLVKQLLKWRFLFGICMGHQILAQSLGAKNYKLKFGHRGSNHPIKDFLLDKIYMSAQNHGYAIDPKSLSEGIKVSHTNLNDQTIAGIFSENNKCLGVQFHPENHPGPRESSSLFDTFINYVKADKKKGFS